MNSPFTMVFLIVVVIIVSDIIKTYVKRGGDKKDGLNDEIQETLSRMNLLEERIQVLERIVTEKRYDLKSQIDGL